MQNGHFDHGSMAKTKRKPKVLPPLYIGQWIRALGFSQAEVSREAPINEGYLSQLVRGIQKKNPSGAMLASIAMVLGIPLGYLYEPPPSPEQIRELRRLDPRVLARLTTIRPNEDPS